MMSVATCGQCGARLRFEDSLGGTLGRCGGCHEIVRLPLPAAKELGSLDLADGAPTEEIVQDKEQAGLTLKTPDRLGRLNHYLVCNSKDVIAHWEDDGKGWMYKVKDGFVRASTVPATVPTMGTFILIEIDIKNVDGHQKLNGVSAFMLSGPWALTKLFKTDDLILEAIVGKAEMNDRHKAMARARINDKFLPQVWDGAEGVLK